MSTDFNPEKITWDHVEADYLPHGLDRADGSDYGGGKVGTSTPDKAIIIQSSSPILGDYVLQEDVDSPTFERAEQGTLTKSFHDIPYDDAVSYIEVLGRGAILTDSSDNDWKVLSATIQSQRGDKATLKLVCESTGFDLPPDEFSCVPVQLGINIIKHPRYFGALNPKSTDYNNSVTIGDIDVSLASIKQAIIRAIQTYQDSPFFPSADNVNGLIQNNIISQLTGDTINVQVPVAGFDPSVKEDVPVMWDGDTANLPDGNYRYLIVSVPTDDEGIQLAQAAAQELIQKLWKIEDSPYMVGFEITWSTYYPIPQELNPGGYVENPLTEASPALPDYFYSLADPPSSDPDADTIFTYLYYYNPQCYRDDGTSDGATQMSCLRQADEVSFERTFFKVTRKWLCSAIGVWDSDICSSGPRPSSPDDYDTLS